jgi:hypothetical protein
MSLQGQWFTITITIIMTCNITMSSSAYVNSSETSILINIKLCL